MEKRALVTCRIVDDIRPIDGADKIELAIIGGWQCVVVKGTLEKGKKCLYHEVDSLLPTDNQLYAFMSLSCSVKEVAIDGKMYSGYRLKTIRLRKHLSQGLALSVEGFRMLGYFKGRTLEIGEDVTDELGVVKYEVPIPAQLQGQIKGSFPAFLPKTDEERVQNLVETIAESQGKMFYITEKLDGTSFTCYKHDNVFGVCSRNMELKEEGESTYWKIANQLDLPNKLPEGYAIQGEIIGPGIQSNRYHRPVPELYVFNVYNIQDGRYLNYVDMLNFVYALGLETVPILCANHVLEETVDNLLAMADGDMSFWLGEPREGLVFRPLEEEIVQIGRNQGRLSFKVISNKWLLKNE